MKLSLYYKLMQINDSDILTMRGMTSQALIAESLESDTLQFDALIPTGRLPAFRLWKYGDPVRIFNAAGNARMATFYVSNVAPLWTASDGAVCMRFDCVSFVGLAVEMVHVGGVYKDATVGDVVAQMFNARYRGKQGGVAYYTLNGTDISYAMDEKIQALRFDGHLPYADGVNRSVRDNLRDVLFSCGASILKRDSIFSQYDTIAWITFNQPSEPVNVPDEKIYVGDKYGRTESVTDVSVVEHYFSGAEAEAVTLYDASVAQAQRTTAIFDEPVAELIVPDGITVHEWGANYAIISGLGVLQGKRFRHSKQIHTQHISDGVPKVKTADVRTVSPYNYHDVLRRISNYYTNAKEVHARFVLDEGVKTGALISFSDPESVKKTGFIKSNNFSSTSITAGDAVVVVDWVPIDVGTDFDTSESLTGSGTWSKAAAEAAIGRAINSMRIVLIGGGAGGQDGENGAAGQRAGAGGTGGLGGSGGECGNVLVIDVDSVPDSISFSCGLGGDIASPGTDTTAVISGANYSSADGEKPLAGMINIVTGELLAMNGEPGVKGGDGWGYGSTGNAGEAVAYNGVTYYGGPINPNADDATWHDVYVDNNGTKNPVMRVDTSTAHAINVSGSGGGGAAVGNNGRGGTGASIGSTKDYHDPIRGRSYTVYVSSARSGSGGKGANAVDRAETPAHGCGGFGGHGGGGGGCSGKAIGEYGGALSWSTRTAADGTKTIDIVKTTNAAIVGTPGAAGLGGKASKGGDGLIWLIY